jgi:hypothetical protein
MRRRHRPRFVLWGARRGDLTYAFVPRQRAVEEGLPIVGSHSLIRDIVTVATNKEFG